MWHCRICFEAEREMENLMAKAEWGVKRTCLSCGVRFYDLKRTPIVCPKCGEELDIAVLQKPKRIRPAARKPAAKVVVKKTEDLADAADDADDVEVDAASDDAVLETDDDDSDVIVAKGGKDDDDSESIEENVLLDDADAAAIADSDEEEDEKDIIEDASELGEDEDDVSEVVEGVESGDAEDR